MLANPTRTASASFTLDTAADSESRGAESTFGTVSVWKQSAPQRFVDMVPPEFWFNFWSGTPADAAQRQVWARVAETARLSGGLLMGGPGPIRRWRWSPLCGCGRRRR